MRLRDSGREWILPPARAAWITAGEPITITIASGITAASALFDPEVFAPPTHRLRVIEMSDLARHLIRACRPFGPDVPETELSQSLFRSIALLAEDAAKAPSQGWQPVAKSPEVSQALAITEANLAKALSFEEIAGAVGLSPRALARRFERELAMTWRQAQRRIRMVTAMGLLLEDGNRPITDVAVSVGYRSLSAFNAAFREHTNQTPTAFRSAHREAEPN